MVDEAIDKTKDVPAATDRLKSVIKELNDIATELASKGDKKGAGHWNAEAAASALCVAQGGVENVLEDFFGDKP